MNEKGEKMIMTCQVDKKDKAKLEKDVLRRLQ